MDFFDIPGYDGAYKISKNGSVFSAKSNKILKSCDDGRGYLSVSLSDGSGFKLKRIHQLMAITFLNHKPCGYDLVVDHIDNNSFNNNIDNLQLISTRENVSKDINNTSSKYTGVCFKKQSNKWVAHIRVNGKHTHIGYFDNEYDAHLAYQRELKKI